MPTAISSKTCKTPVAAGQGSGGRRYNIVPGDPDKSRLIEAVNSGLKEPAYNCFEPQFLTVTQN